MKKKIVFILCSILLLCLIILIIVKQYSKNSKIQIVNNKSINDKKVIIPSNKYKKIDIDYDNLNLEVKKRSIYINHLYKDDLFISIVDMNNQDPYTLSLYTTPEIVTYNLKNKESKIINYNEDKRIWDYIIFNNKIYYTTVNYTQDNSIEWDIISSDLNFDNKKILKTGIILNGFVSPNIIVNNDKIYVTTFDSTEKNYNIYQINDESLNLLYSIDSDVETITQFTKIYIDDENIYYMIVDNEKSQSLCKYNYKKKNKEIIYSINNNEWNLFEFLIMDDFYVIDIYDSNRKSKLIYVYKDGTNLESNNNVFLSFFRKLGNDKILTNNGNKLFRLFNKNGLEELVFEFENLDPDYKYIIYNLRYMVITNSDPNELYIYDLNEL